MGQAGSCLSVPPPLTSLARLHPLAPHLYPLPALQRETDPLRSDVHLRPVLSRHHSLAFTNQNIIILSGGEEDKHTCLAFFLESKTTFRKTSLTYLSCNWTAVIEPASPCFPIRESRFTEVWPAHIGRHLTTRQHHLCWPLMCEHTGLQMPLSHSLRQCQTVILSLTRKALLKRSWK